MIAFPWFGLQCTPQGLPSLVDCLIDIRCQITDDARADLKRAIGEFKEQFQASAATARA